MKNHFHSKTTGLQLRLLVRAVVVIALLCGFSAAGWAEVQGVGGKRDIDVATVNLYVGADFTPIITAGSEAQLLAAVAAAYDHIKANDFSKRADALAAEIALRGPDLIALQEVSLIQRWSPAASIAAGAPPVEQLDYLKTLLDALELHGAHYAVVSQVQDTVVPAPLLTGFGLDLLILTDREVILARTDLPPGYLRLSNRRDGNFDANLPLPIGVTVLRGWCSIDVQVRGRQLRVINTHLEDFPAIQYAQALELIEGPAKTSLPVVLAGDFNSDANGLYSPDTYTLLTTVGRFSDAWSTVHPGTPGPTWGHDELLSNPAVPFPAVPFPPLRLDLVLYRGRGLSATEAEIVNPLLLAPPPLWFSDHAGVFTSLAVQ